MKNTLYLLALLFLLSCGDAAPATTEAETLPTETTTPSLEMVWETDTLLATAESVLYDTDRDRFYVANVNQNPWELDGNGFLSVVGKDGKIIVEKLVSEGLSGPKGMGRIGNVLYVADIDAVVEIDLEAGAIVKRHPVPGGTNLNDITVAADGTVYVSDSGTGKAHRMEEDGSFTTIVEGLQRPNGLLALADGHLLMGDTKGQQLLRANPADGTKEVFATGVEPDGIVAVGDGSYLVSRWGGQIHHVSAEGKTTLLLDTEAEGSQTADIEFIQDEKLLLVPAFFQNRVVAYRLKI